MASFEQSEADRLRNLFAAERAKLGSRFAEIYEPMRCKVLAREISTTDLRAIRLSNDPIQACVNWYHEHVAA